MNKNILSFLFKASFTLLVANMLCVDSMHDSHIATIHEIDENGLLPQIIACHRQMERTNASSPRGRCTLHRLRIHAARCASKLCDQMPEEHRRKLRDLADNKHATTGSTCSENCGMLFI